MTSSTSSSTGSARVQDATLGQPQTFWRARGYAWLDLLVATGATAGFTTSALYSVQFRTSTFAASDFKTLYASTWCFTHGMDAYSIANLQKVFLANGVAQPERWYAHAPVYPWPTLAILSPLASLGMVPAIYVLTILSGILLAVALTALMRYAANNFDMGPAWRMAIAGLCACGPLLAFGMNVGNVSVAASSLCFLAFVRRTGGAPWQRGVPWLPAAALAIAILLKPHLALWVGAGMFLLPERAARAVAVRAVVLTTGFVALAAGVMAVFGTLGVQTRGYLVMLSTEASAGASMNATSREVLPPEAQITSLASIVGFWISNPAVRVGLTCLLLLGLGFLLARRTGRVNTERGALLAVGTWCALGMLATYHRAHDAVLLLMILPWVIDRVRRTPLTWPVWATTGLYCAMSLSADLPLVQHWVAAAPQHSFVGFILLRQVGLADLLLVPVLLLAMGYELARQGAMGSESAEEDEMRAAA